MNESMPGNNHLSYKQLLQQPYCICSNPAEDGINQHIRCAFTSTQISLGRDDSEELKEAGASGHQDRWLDFVLKSLTVSSERKRPRPLYRIF